MGQIAEMAQRSPQVGAVEALKEALGSGLARISELPQLIRGKDHRDAAVYFIKDNGDLVPNVEEKLGEGYRVEIITGPRFKDAETREKLALLLEKYSVGRLSIYACQSRPRRNVQLINGNLLYEDPHAEGSDYEAATAVEHADDYNIGLFHNNFANLKCDADLMCTPNQIRQMPVLK
jgi:hypothetical protein